MAALVDGVLVDRVLSVLWLWKRSRPRSAVRGPGRLMFNVVPGTEAEIGRIAKTFRELGGRGLQVLTKSEATEEAFRTDAPRHRWIHLATRGFFSPTGVPSGA